MPVRRHFYDYKSGNFKDLCSLFSHVPFDMFVIALPGNIDECWVQLKGFFLSAVDQNIPTKMLSIRTCLLGMTTRFAKKKKNTALRIYRLNKNDHNKLKLRSQSHNVKYLVRRKHDSYLEKIELSRQSNGWSNLEVAGSIPTEVKGIVSLPRVVPWFPLVGITPSGSFMASHSTLIYTLELILCSTICVHSATRHNIHMYPYFLFAAIHHLNRPRLSRPDVVAQSE